MLFVYALWFLLICNLATLLNNACDVFNNYFSETMFEDWYLNNDIEFEEMLGKRQHHFNDDFPIKNYDESGYIFQDSDCQSVDIKHLSQSETPEFNIEYVNHDHECQSKNNTIGYNRDSESTNEDDIQLECQPETEVISEQEESLVEKKAKKRTKRATKAKKSKKARVDIENCFNKEQPDRSYFGKTLKLGYKLGYSQTMDEDISKSYDDDLARKCIMLLYNRSPDEEITKEAFAKLLKTKEFVNNRRKDEQQKKVWSKITWHVYGKKFKTKSRITKETAFNKMKIYYRLEKAGKLIIFNRLWGEDKKKGMQNDAVLEILTNERLIVDFLSKEVLDKLLSIMHEQTGNDIEIILIDRFDKDREDLLTYLSGESDQVVIVRDGKKPVKRSAQQQVKLPMTCNDNVKAMIEFLKKLQHRAQVEDIPRMVKMLQNRIEHFSRMLF